MYENRVYSYDVWGEVLQLCVIGGFTVMIYDERVYSYPVQDGLQ